MESWSAFFDDVLTAALRPFAAVVTPDTMIYWPYLVAAGVLALALPVITGRGAVLKRLAEPFAKRIWWGASARADYAYYVVNGILFPVIVAPAIFTSFQIGEALSGGLAALFGPRTAPLFGGAAMPIAYTLVFLLAYDLGRFLAHLAQHRYPLLWQFHKVHHSAEALTPITSFRVHPVDLLVMAAGGNLLGGIATGVFLYIGGGAVNVYTFLGVHIGVGIYNLIGNLRHSHVWLDYGPLSYVFISPAQHQIHHSVEPRHRDRNCGFAFAFWDLLFGTLYVPKGRERFAMGLGDGTDGTWHRVTRLYLWPFALAARLVTGRGTVPDAAAAKASPGAAPGGISDSVAR